ncbi:MAG: hypothetical protein M1827_001929 [Pycnora praestabilis]|nr:MAG: hypothetical protein M1827_001929 [Pycnora praestabilis]
MAGVAIGPTRTALSTVIQDLESCEYPLDKHHDEYLTIFRTLKRIFRFSHRDAYSSTASSYFYGDQEQAGCQTFLETFKWFRSWLQILHRSMLLYPMAHTALSDLRRRATIQLQSEVKWFDPQDDEFMNLAADSQDFVLFYQEFYNQFIGRQVHLSDDAEIAKNLLLGEDVFERSLRRTHVEDCLMAKRLRLDDLLTPTGQPVIASLNTIFDINDLERDVFSIRYLRQHRFSRPWERLYIVIDDRSQRIHKASASVAKFLKKSRPSKVLDVWPIGLKDLADLDCALYCGSDLVDGDLLIKQHCGHFGHRECLFGYWDRGDVFSFPCPTCRQDPGPIANKISRERLDSGNIPGFRVLTQEEHDEEYFDLIQETLNDDLTLLEAQIELPLDQRRAALRHQAVIYEQWRQEDEIWDAAQAEGRLTNLANPAGPTSAQLRHPRVMRGQPYELYPPEEDVRSHYYEPAHYHEEANQWLEENEETRQWIVRHRELLWGEGRDTNLVPEGMQRHHYSAWRQDQRRIGADVLRFSQHDQELAEWAYGLVGDSSCPFREELIENPMRRPAILPMPLYLAWFRAEAHDRAAVGDMSYIEAEYRAGGGRYPRLDEARQWFLDHPDDIRRMSDNNQFTQRPAQIDPALFDVWLRCLQEAQQHLAHNPVAHQWIQDDRIMHTPPPELMDPDEFHVYRDIINVYAPSPDPDQPLDQPSDPENGDEDVPEDHHNSDPSPEEDDAEDLIQFRRRNTFLKWTIPENALAGHRAFKASVAKARQSHCRKLKRRRRK